jgi:hypothetical protein
MDMEDETALGVIPTEAGTRPADLREELQWRRDRKSAAAHWHENKSRDLFAEVADLELAIEALTWRDEEQADLSTPVDKPTTKPPSCEGKGEGRTLVFGPGWWGSLASPAESSAAPIPPGFTKWEGGECPVEPGREIAVLQRDGSIINCDRYCTPYTAYSGWAWRHIDSPTDIIAYRIIEAADSAGEGEDAYLATLPRGSYKDPAGDGNTYIVPGGVHYPGSASWPLPTAPASQSVITATAQPVRSDEDPLDKIGEQAPPYSTEHEAVDP